MTTKLDKMLYMQVYASGILDIEKFGKKLEIEYKRDKKESLSITEDDVKFGLFQLEANRKNLTYI